MHKRYKVSIAVVLLIFMGLLITTICKWRVWFSIPPETSYSVPSVPDRISLTFGENALSERTLTWRCDTMLQTSYVRIIRDTERDTMSLPAKGKMVFSRSGKQAYYYLRLSGLKANSKYSYRVQSGNQFSTWHCFTTAKDRNQMNFLLFGDVQDELGKDSHYLFMEANAHYPQAQFWAFVGDVIERPEDKYWNIFLSSIVNIEGDKPLIVCAGNHEYIKGLHNTLDSRWTDTFMYPDNGDVCHKGSVYYIDFPLLRYIVLNTEGLQNAFDYVSTLNWLGKVLSSNKRHWTIVMMHHPVYSSALHRNNLLLKWMFRPLFDKYKVDMVIAGHDHSYMRRNTGASTPVYLDCNSSTKYYMSNCDPSADRLCTAHCLYQYIEISDSTLQMKSYLADNDSLYDDIIINKKNNRAQVTSNIGRKPEMLDIPATHNKAKTLAFVKLRDKRLHSLKYQ